MPITRSSALAVKISLQPGLGDKAKQRPRQKMPAEQNSGYRPEHDQRHGPSRADRQPDSSLVMLSILPRSRRIADGEMRRRCRHSSGSASSGIKANMGMTAMS